MDPALWELLRAQEGADGDRVLETVIRLARPGIEIPGVRIVSRFGTIATCRIPARDVIAVRARRDVISVKAARVLSPGFEPPSALPDVASPAVPSERVTDVRRGPALGLTGTGVVVAAVDWGVDVDSAAFRWPDDPAAADAGHEAGATRFLSFWDQRDQAAGPRPHPYGYGTVHSREEIDRALRDPRPYERLGYHPAIADRTGRGTHGTRTVDIAAGNGQGGGPAGIAPNADLIFVHLADRNTGGLANFGDSVRLLEAVDFISRTAGPQPCVINISAGRICGPKDGTTLVERAFDELLAVTPGRFVVNSAGNYFGWRTHSCGTLAPGEVQSLTFAVGPADITVNELEIWYDGADEFAVRIDPPGYTGGRPVRLGERSDLLIGGRVVGRIYHRKCDPNNGDNHIVAYLDPISCAGNWTVTLEARRVSKGRFHAWIERDDSCPDCQARFTHDDSNPATTIGSIASSHLPLIVGAYDGHDPARPVATFSSAGPCRDGRGKPDLVAPGVGVLAARSAPIGASRNPGLLVRGSGTSFAAPHVTGAVALCFEAASNQLSAQEIRSLVLASCDPVPDADPQCRLGRGYLNIPRLVADTQQALAAPATAPSSKLAEKAIDGALHSGSRGVTVAPAETIPSVFGEATPNLVAAPPKPQPQPQPKVDTITPHLKIPYSIDGMALSPAGARTWTVTSQTRDIATVRKFQVINQQTGQLEKRGEAILAHGLLVPDLSDTKKFLVPTPMRIVFPVDPAKADVLAGTKKLPLVVIVHGNHAAWEPVWAPPTTALKQTDSAGTVHIIPIADTATSVTNVPNHEGYGFLQDALAKEGIVSVSVNTNAANFFDSGIDMREQTVVAAMTHMKKLNEDPTSKYHGRLGLHNIGLMGHSRGGDVVVALARRLRGDARFTVKAVCSIAPTDFTGTATDHTQLRLAADDVGFYLVIYGSLDGDVSGLGGADNGTGTGFRHYDRTACPKAMVQLSRCCHNRFNAVWSGGSPPAPFSGDDDALSPLDKRLLRSFDDHQKLEVEYAGGVFLWQLKGDPTVKDVLDGTRPNTAGIPGSLQWSFGSRTLPLDDLEDASRPALAGASRRFVMGLRTQLADIQVPESTLNSGGSDTARVPIAEHVTHRSHVLLVDATIRRVSSEAMTLEFPAAKQNWNGFDLLTFRLSATLNISDIIKYATSPDPRAALTIIDTVGTSRRLADATAFTLDVPSSPAFHLVDYEHKADGSTIRNATLFRFETVRVPLAEFAGGRGVNLTKVRRLIVEFDPANNTQVLFDSFQLVKR